MNSKYTVSKTQQGTALVLTLIVLGVLSLTISALTQNVGLDLRISKNLKDSQQAFNWAEAGLDVTEEMIAIAINSRGEDNSSTYSMNLHGKQYVVENIGNSLFEDNSIIRLSTSSEILSRISANQAGSATTDGSSIIIAAGYQGVGKGAGSGASVMHFYQLEANGSSTSNQSLGQAKEVYGFISGGN